jgi:hypothetical protein
MFGCPDRSVVLTRSVISIAAAAVRHFPSLGKSRNVVLTATPPLTDPLNTSVVNIKVHIDLTPDWTRTCRQLIGCHTRRVACFMAWCLTPGKTRHAMLGYGQRASRVNDTHVISSNCGASPANSVAAPMIRVVSSRAGSSKPPLTVASRRSSPYCSF